MLTTYQNPVNLTMHSKKTSVRTATPEITTGHKTAINAVFLRLSKMNATLIRIQSFMVDCIGQLSGWSVPVADCCNPVQSASNCLQPKRGGYIPITGAAMNTINPSKDKIRNQLTSLINIVMEGTK